MPNVYMDEPVRVQSVGAGGIGFDPPTPVEKVDTINGNVRGAEELVSPTGRIPNPLDINPGESIKADDGGWSAGESIPSVVYGEKTTIVNETTVTFTKDGDNAWYTSPVNPISGMTFEEGKLYTVTWDSVEYALLYKIINIPTYSGDTVSTGTHPCHTVGSFAVIGMDDTYESDAPFLINKWFLETDRNNIYIFTTSTEAQHTIKVEVETFTPDIVPLWKYQELSEGRPILAKGSGVGSAIMAGASKASGLYAIAIGAACEATGAGSFAIGQLAKAQGPASHAEGISTKASVAGSKAEGCLTTASGFYAHAEGYQTIGSSIASHAEGLRSVASGQAAHAAGEETIANHRAQFTFGQWNVADPSTAAVNARGNYVEIVGNGTSGNARSNARTLDWSGNEALAGSITLGKGTADEVTLTAAQVKALLALLT